MKFNIGDRVRIKPEEYLRCHKRIDNCTCVSEMYKFAGLECIVVGVHNTRKVERYTLRNAEYPCIDEWVWVPHWLESIRDINIQADILLNLLQMESDVNDKSSNRI